MDKLKEFFDWVKASSEKIVGDKAPWWVVPFAVVVLLVIVL